MFECRWFTLDKSSGTQLWPIVMSLSVSKNIVEILGVYQCLEKPKNANDFLKRFVEEATSIIDKGFIHNDKKYVVAIIAFICDHSKSFLLIAQKVIVRRRPSQNVSFLEY